MSRANVMIVDDDQDLAESLAEFLEMSGCSVTTAANGKEAVLGHGKQDFDVTFMDVRMPIMNGVDSFFEIRKLKPDAKIVMMTGFKEAIVTKALEAGAAGLLNKPFDIEAMLAIVDKAA
jgi:two-component system, NtrC family, response regulator HydG